ncbi:MAG: HAD family phosphatase [Cypionkella sp.]|uniref:HAD family hydrolase n=1 Tax=Cypionkella sp. TaxID=2811411 RepID=UPI002ABC1CD1|nr:HAD family phosphatase [Cypionkella sp.]MDZ4310278.1 HAD family phosphatase [Cypionkella sp.]MDZ4393566.1 HAD family phosphatase [Cypionkella sp.]
MFDAIFFDLDGTLIDTESLAMASGLAAFAELGHPVTEAFLHQLVGVDLPTGGKIIRAAMPLIDPEALHPLWQGGFRAAMDENGLNLKAGALDLLQARLLPMALVTSSGRQEAHHKLAIAGIAEMFDLIITVDDVTAPKPNPAPYLLAAEKLGVATDRCLVFEDSETGAEAAHRAGCFVVQIPDVVPSQGRWAHHLADNLLAGARHAGLLI